MDRIRTNTTTNRNLSLSQPPLSSDSENKAPNGAKPTSLHGALLFGKSLNAGADTILTKFSEFGVIASSTMKSMDHLTDTTGILGNILKIEDTVKGRRTGVTTGGLSNIIRKGAGIFNSITGIISIAEAHAADRMTGDTSYSGTMKAIGKCMGQMTVGTLGTAGVVALAPASASALAVAVAGGALVTGGMIVSGKVLDYIMA